MKLTITSKDNTQIKYLRKLISSSKFRKEEEKFVIEGSRICDEALKNNLNIKKVFYTEKFYEKNISLINQISKVASEVILISESIAKSISDTENPQGIIAICENIANSFDNLNLENIQKVVLLENIQNYILNVLKSNPRYTFLIEHIKILEDAKRQVKLGMRPVNILDDLCLKLIK